MSALFSCTLVADEVAKRKHTVCGVPLTVTKAWGAGRGCKPEPRIAPPEHPSQAQSQHQTHGQDEVDLDEVTTLKAASTGGKRGNGTFYIVTLTTKLIMVNQWWRFWFVDLLASKPLYVWRIHSMFFCSAGGRIFISPKTNARQNSLLTET